MAPEVRITEEQAAEALRALHPREEDPQEPEQPEAPAPAPAPAEEPTPAVGEATEVDPADEPALAADPGSDDVASLKARLSSEKQRYDDGIKAMQTRFEQNQRIIHDRFLRKAAVADRAHKILKQSRTEQGVPQEEVDRVIAELEGSMNPNSPSYSPAPVQSAHSEDQAITMNNFLNEKSMTMAEADEFGNWLRNEGQSKLTPSEQQVAGRDLDGFLRIAHNRFSESLRQKDKSKVRDDAVEAARSVQRTQREAARAASATAVAPKKQPTTRPKGIDVRKLTRQDVSDLLKQSVQDEYAQ